MLKEKSSKVTLFESVCIVQLLYLLHTALPSRPLSKQKNMNIDFGFRKIKVVALAAKDINRAQQFYSRLGFTQNTTSTDEVGYQLGATILIFRTGYEPSADLNPRITLEVEDARATERQLLAAEIEIVDPVKLYKQRFWVGSFLDSEGNKLWFCSYAEGQ